MFGHGNLRSTTSARLSDNAYRLELIARKSFFDSTFEKAYLKGLLRIERPSEMHDDTGSTQARVHPLHWSWARTTPPRLDSEHGPWGGALLRAWSGTSPVMVQPPLDHHYVVMHLGGAKRVSRRGDGPALASVVEDRSITLVPAGSANVWKTEGPIAFAHLYLPPAALASTIDVDFDGEGREATLMARVGSRDAQLEPLLATMLDEIGHGEDAAPLRLDCLYDSVRRRLASLHSSHRPTSKGRAMALAPHRLRRVVEFVEANLGRGIRLVDLASAATSGQSHFSHAFQIATGLSPYQYVLRERIESAKVMLMTSDAPLEDVAARCGFHSRDQLSRMFKRVTGVSPRRYRALRRALLGHP
jgi:AraC family transcriptional regulator